MKISRIMIASASSESGKTTVICGIMKALSERGLKVKGCKCGPDYIDAMFHKKALGTDSINIDLFFSNRNTLLSLLSEHSEYADITLLEGMMGYYDGLSFGNCSASSFDIARQLNMPSLLVINAKGMALSAAALIKGFANFKPDSGIKGFILNNASEGVYEKLKCQIEKNTGIRGYGYVPPLEFEIRSRHLGLVAPDDVKDLDYKMSALGDIIKNTIDLDGVMELANSAEEIFCEKINIHRIGKIRTAVAKDEAFCFYYHENLKLLEKAGCEIIFFSPLRDKKLPDDIQLLIIGGGYPELYLDKLSSNKSMLEDIRIKLESGLYCLAECGGFMYLGESIEDKEGKKFEMVSFIEAESAKKSKLVRFGYINLNIDNYDIKAHEFHYWDSTQNGDYSYAEKPDGRKWKCMVKKNNTLAGFPHLYYYSNVDFIMNILTKCRRKRLISVIGGSGSGKSEFAENVALEIHKSKKGRRLYYVASMIPMDEETVKKIERHRKMRAGKGFETIECYRDIEKINFEENSTVIIECISNLLANEMFSANPAENAERKITSGIDAICKKCDVVIVTNDIFKDGETYDESTTDYIKKLAYINSYAAQKSDTFVELVYSVPVYHKGGENFDF